MAVFVIGNKINLVVESGTRKGRALVMKRERSTAYFCFGGESDEQKGI